MTPEQIKVRPALASPLADRDDNDWPPPNPNRLVFQTIGDDLDKLTSVAASAVTPLQQTPLDDGQMARLIRVRHNRFTRYMDKPHDHHHQDGGSGTRQAASPAALAFCLVIALALMLGAGRCL